MDSCSAFARTAVAVVAVLFAAVPGCKSDDDSSPGTGGSSMCTAPGGPVEDGVKDTHCTDASGDPIVQPVGKCVTSAAATGEGGAAGAANDETYTVLTGHEGSDDDCKYDVSFTTTGCVEVNHPVTFNVTLTTRATGKAATGANAQFPEVFLADDPSHISPSSDIKAPEHPSGTYAIGPIVFDKAGRWVVRFHFYEECSDIPKDSPHGHIAFYIDVP
jgi:hypothetical protein